MSVPVVICFRCFSEQCEELRSAASQRRREDIVAEHKDQIHMKQERAQQQREEEDYFARMWFADMEAKARREQEAVQRQTAANRETSAVLEQQIAELEAKKRHEKELLEEQAQILVGLAVLFTSSASVHPRYDL